MDRSGWPFFMSNKVPLLLEVISFPQMAASHCDGGLKNVFKWSWVCIDSEDRTAFTGLDMTPGRTWRPIYWSALSRCGGYIESSSSDCHPTGATLSVINQSVLMNCRRWDYTQHDCILVAKLSSLCVINWKIYQGSKFIYKHRNLAGHLEMNSPAWCK